MHKKLLALSLALVFCVCPTFAVSDADNSFYTFEPVFDNSSGGCLMTASVTGWTDTDHGYLNDIRLALTSNRTGTLLGYVASILNSVRSSYDKLVYIKQNTDYLQNMNNNSNNILSYLRTDLNGPAIRDFLSEIELNTRNLGTAWTEEQSALVTGFSKSIFELFSSDTYAVIPFYHADSNGNAVQYWSSSIPYSLGIMFSSLQHDFKFVSGEVSLYGLILRLQETLASDDDKALADAQKPNRDQIEQDFVSGQSGGTSLGPSDFGDLSNVGGTIKDSISLNGQASVGGFTGGLADADKEGQGWFSASTRDALDAVTPSLPAAADMLDDDPYNMSGFVENYAWLYGG